MGISGQLNNLSAHLDAIRVLREVTGQLVNKGIHITTRIQVKIEGKVAQSLWTSKHTAVDHGLSDVQLYQQLSLFVCVHHW